MSTLTWYHRDARFELGAWTCTSDDTAPGAVEASSRPVLAFTRRGVYRRHVGSREAVVDAGTVASYPRWMEYRVSHPGTGGDRSLVVALTGEGLESAGVESLAGGELALSTRGLLLVERVEMAVRDGEALAVEELLLHLVEHVFDGLVEGPPPAPPADPTAAAHRRAIRRAKQSISLRYGERLTLDDIARDAGYSVPHLCEVFRRGTGFTIHRYLSRLRLSIALEGLTDASRITRLAYEVGFSTPSHFSTAFRREFGHPPSRLLSALRREDVARLRP